MRFTLRRSLVATAGAAALLGGTLIAPSLAGAQTSESFTVSPSTVVEGGTVTFTATGCVLDGVDEPNVDIDLFDNLLANNLPVDAEGTATFQLTLVENFLDPGSYTFTAYCYDPEVEDSGFTYEQQAVLDVTAAPVSTTTSTTAAPAAAAAATVTPAFTG